MYFFEKEVGNLYYIFEKIIREKGITLYRVSKDTGIPYATLSDWKNGKSQPKLNTLLKICSYLGIPITDLISQEEQSQKGCGANE